MKKVILILVLILAIACISGCADSGTYTDVNQIDANVVVSGSMEPALYEGDVVIVDKNPDNIEVGDIVIYNATWFDKPIIHRVISIEEDSKGNTIYETKGDKNSVPDPEPVSRNQITSKVINKIPKVGNIILD